MEENKKLCYRSIAVNLVLSLGKLFAGWFGHSAAMVSDAVHSASDVFSTVIVIIGLSLSEKEEDDDHEYGHERLECVAGLLLAFVLAATGLLIGYKAIEALLSPTKPAQPGIVALCAAAISIAVKEGMFRVTRAQAKKTDSTALMADAWHHRSDALSSIGSLIGIAGARLGLTALDPIASLVICGFIVKAAWDIYAETVEKLTDHAAPPEVEERMRAYIGGMDGVRRLDSLRTREFGSRLYIDVEIAADGNQTLKAAHAIAERVHDGIEESFPAVKHCMVHVNPDDERSASA